MKVIEIDINNIKEYENNPRNNEVSIEPVARSIEEFGFKVPIIIDKNNIIVAGHTRLKAAKKLKFKTIPCVIAEDLTNDQIKAFRLADNKTSELAEWDFEKLEEELKELQNLDLGFSMLDFGFKVKEATDTEEEVEEDNFNIEEEIEEITEPITKEGYIYILGNHKLICGDATKKETYKILMQNEKADLIVTDPPYNVAVTNSKGMTIENDNITDKQFKELLYRAFNNISRNLKPGGAFYIWYADSEAINFRNACRNNNLDIKQCLIWVKNGINLGKQDYQWKHEPCLYGWKEGATHYFIDDRTQETVIEDRININKLKKEEMKDLIKELLKDRTATTIIREDKPLENTEHPTMKPIKLLSRHIRNSSKTNEIVLDTFGGSGSTLIACEQLNRQCRMIELDPKYCDVIVKRWEEYTGLKAKLINKEE